MAQINLGHVVGQGVPSGGTAGQILKKNGSTNFDTSWATLDGSMVPVSAGDSTTVQQSLAAVKSDMGIVEDGNTATHTIAAGQYVIWKGALYTASAAIPAGTTLSTSNLAAVSGGGLNALNGKIAKVKEHWTSVYTDEVNITEGTIGTRGAQVAIDIPEMPSTGAYVLGILITNIQNSGYDNIQAFLYNGKVYFNFYRCVTIAHSNSAYARVFWVEP